MSLFKYENGIKVFKRNPNPDTEEEFVWWLAFHKPQLYKQLLFEYGNYIMEEDLKGEKKK